MAYIPPAISAAGLTVPAYDDILDDNLAQTQAIYGQNIYLGTDSPLFQMISIISAKQADTMLGLQLLYDSRSPQTAIGAALDSLMKLNGLVRNSAFPSTCVVNLTGDPNTNIAQGVVRDNNGILWDLPANTVLGNTGLATTTATCEVPGPISADIATLVTINSPQAGWDTVTNPSAAVVGEGVETDSALRARQTISVALPALTTLGSTVAAIGATPGVTRYNVLENPTGTTDGFGNPAHSLTAVVEGGSNLDVATAIYGKHGIGCFTNGTVSQPVTDPFTGSVFTVNFDRPTAVPIFVSISIHGLFGYTSAIVTLVQTALVNYLNALQIGEAVTLSALYAIAQNITPNLLTPTFSIRALTLGLSASPSGTSDLTLTFNQVASGTAAHVVVTVV